MPSLLLAGLMDGGRGMPEQDHLRTEVILPTGVERSAFLLRFKLEEGVACCLEGGLRHLECIGKVAADQLAVSTVSRAANSGVDRRHHLAEQPMKGRAHTPAPHRLSTVKTVTR
jgi:hypothetical protein